MSQLPLVSVVFISYNRPHTLVAAYEGFLAHTDYPRDRLELVLSDDCSNEFTRAVYKELPFDRVAVAAKNQGLGANQNRGVRSATADYLLMIQDDWMAVGPSNYLRRAVSVLEANQNANVVNFICVDSVPIERREKICDEQIIWLGTKLSAVGDLEQLTDQPYTDQPHLKRRSFHDRFGFYDESLAVHRLELGFARQLVKSEASGFVRIEGLTPFRDIGRSFTLNPGNLRAARIERWSRLPILGPLFKGARVTAKRLLRRS